VDASPEIGTGHVMRCLALAQAWQASQGPVLFALAAVPPALEARLRAEEVEVAPVPASPGSAEDAQATAELALQRGARWTVVDGQHFGSWYQQQIKEAGLLALAIDDDGHAQRYVADIVLNQNLHAHEAMYPHRAPSTRLLLGSTYVLLRREFWPWRGWTRQHPPVARRVLVTLGGADPDNMTLMVIQALSQLKGADLDLTAVVGGGNPNYERLRSAAAQAQPPVRLLCNVANMPELMAQAEVAVSSGGTTVWEMALMGLPAVVGIIAPVEELLASGLRQHGLYWHAGWLREMAPARLAEMLALLIRDQEARQAMSRLGQRLIDGLGASRVVQAMTEGDEA